MTGLFTDLFTQALGVEQVEIRDKEFLLSTVYQKTLDPDPHLQKILDPDPH